MSIPGAADIRKPLAEGDLIPLQDKPSPVAGFEGLTLFNVAVGLRRTQGDPALYRRLLRKFLDGNGDFEAAFLGSTKACDPRAAERLAHTLKGLAATIEATTVAKSAALLERACREESDPSPHLQAVVACLHPCLDQLRAYFGHPAAVPEAEEDGEAVVITPAMIESLKRVAALLQDGDGDASEALDHFLAENARMRHPLTQIRQLVGGYDFFGAHDELMKLAESWGMAL